MIWIFVAAIMAGFALIVVLLAFVAKMPPSQGARRASFGVDEGFAGGSDVAAGLSDGGGHCHSGDFGGGDCGGGDGGGD